MRLFSLYVLFILFFLSLGGIWLWLGKKGVFQKVGEKAEEVKDAFKDKEEK